MRPERYWGRREFIRQTIQSAAAISVGLGCAPKEGMQETGGHPPAVQTPTTAKSKVVLVRHEGVLDSDHHVQTDIVRDMLQEAMCAFTGKATTPEAWSRFFVPGDTVGIKVNVFNGTATHPEITGIIADNLAALGIEDDRILTWDRTGAHEQAGRGRAEISSLPGRFGHNEEYLSQVVTEHASALINAPTAKVHWLSGVAVSLKNWVGAVGNINVRDRDVSYAIHDRSCAECCRINALPQVRQKTRLIIVDALRPLFSGGPQVDPRYLWDYKGILVATDPVAVDTVCYQILQAKRDEFRDRPWPITPPVTHLEVAETKYGLGTSAPEAIDLLKIGSGDGMLI